ncbi:hypothetical protein HPB49_005368 [Dermacentor silvarum]|uniref:Uncharacterized protein n=1 Tax=Dermacentor silvarum TaxID=543639 RepID=A0ACB8CDK0_DERSI|nr:hypothetical protein HPB49_005368 [Dermacentor silvarum]
MDRELRKRDQMAAAAYTQCVVAIDPGLRRFFIAPLEKKLPSYFSTGAYFWTEAGTTGSPCESDSDCRRASHYACHNHSCACQVGHHEELVNSSLSCVFVGVPVGERCLSDESCINRNRTHCGSRHICVCRRGYYEHGGVCKTGRKLGDPCRSDAQCEAGSNASACRGSACRCKDGYYQESIGGNSTCVPEATRLQRKQTMTEASSTIILQFVTYSE